MTNIPRTYQAVSNHAYRLPKPIDVAKSIQKAAGAIHRDWRVTVCNLYPSYCGRHSCIRDQFW